VESILPSAVVRGLPTRQNAPASQILTLASPLIRIGGCVAAYWAMIDRETDGRFIASIPDLEDLAA
jgi:hypothetical protein